MHSRPGLRCHFCPSRTQVVRSLQLLLFVAILSGCSLLQPSYYDPTTFRNLTALKPKVAMLYETFTYDPLNEEKIAEIRLELAQVYEYEKGKGESNRETARQVQLIREMFERHVEHRQKQGKWSVAFMQNALQNIQEAFDTAIRTERLKNKNE
ncbi:MAG: hypothetical protein HY347_07790 [candidate division NC10 bacterium]|nr:hypothetical protein [candidate division NC10 bacterium]